MLVEFSVANYRSFRNRVTLSLVASSEKDHPGNAFPAGSPSRLRLLRAVGIYGANASGKSNLIKALNFVRSFVLQSARKSGYRGDITVVPFRLDAVSAAQPSEFEVVFIHRGERYHYGFSTSAEAVHAEWLTAARRKPRLLFRRDPSGSFEFGPSWRGDGRRIAAVTPPSALFLSVAAQFANPTVQPVFEWFESVFRGISDNPEIGGEAQFTIESIRKDDDFARRVTQFLSVADLAIDGISVRAVPLRESQRWERLPEEVRQHVLSRIPEDKRGEAEIVNVETLHRTGEDTGVTFDLAEDESGGTNRLFALAGPWLHTLDKGLVLFLDELDTKLHPLLTRSLVNLVHRSAADAQVIFTTHDSSLMDSSLFRRDQIWFAEKDQEGSTDLFSLWDYKARKDENYRGGYLRGRYGAVPFIGEFPY